MKDGSAGSPSPDSIRGTDRADPESSAAVFIYADRPSSGATVLAVALIAAGSNRTERPFEIGVGGRPNRARTIFDELGDRPSAQGLVAREFPILPAGQPGVCTDPQRSVACQHQ